MLQKLWTRVAKKIAGEAAQVPVPLAEVTPTVEEVPRQPTVPFVISCIDHLDCGQVQVYAPVETLPVTLYSNPDQIGYSVGVEHWPGDKSSCKAEVRWSSTPEGPELQVRYSGELAEVPGACLNIRFFFETPPVEPTGFATIGGARITVSEPERLEFICAVFRRDEYLGGNTTYDMRSEMDFLVAHDLQAAAGRPSLEFRFSFLRPISEGEQFSVKFSRLFIGERFSPSKNGIGAPPYIFPAGSTQNEAAELVLKEFEEEAVEHLKTSKFGGVQAFCRPYVVSRGDGARTYPIVIGTANSVHWYGETTDHDIGFFEKAGLVKKGGVVMDCGAHAGRIAIHLAHLVGPQGMVFAFDPFPQNNIQIEANAKVNGMKNIFCEWAGVGPDFGEIEVSNVAQNLMASEQGDVIKVKQVPLDSYLEYSPTFIKIDVEGYEGEVLKGAQKLLRECRPVVLVEVHPQFIGSFGATFESLVGLIPLDLYDVWTQFESGLPARPYYKGINEVVGDIVDIIAMPKKTTKAAGKNAP